MKDVLTAAAVESEGVKASSQTFENEGVRASRIIWISRVMSLILLDPKARRF